MNLDGTTFLEIVKNTPLVAIDLIVYDELGRVLLGLRRNRPAQGTWFVPGGRILKDEHIADAFRRLTREELGLEMAVEQSRFMGVFEHFYPDNYGDLPGFGTHYVSLGYELKIPEGLNALPEEQHHDYRWWGLDKMLKSGEVHPNTKGYFI